MPADKDTDFGFEDVGTMPVADRGDMKVEKMAQRAADTVLKERVEANVRGDLGAEKPKGPGMTKDVPQAVFRIAASLIGCPKFNLTDEEAEQMATHLNILLPLDGKMISLVFILLTVLNKVSVCMDAIKAKMGQPKDELKPEAGEKKPDLPEPLG